MSASHAAIGLGSNLGGPQRQLVRALWAIARLPQVQLLRVSSFFRSAPVGCELPQEDYVNATAIVRTTLTPSALLAALRGIERRQGRDRGGASRRNAPRTLDLDLLLYAHRRIASVDLTIPHPRMHERAFVLRPLREIEPAAIIPGMGLARHRLRDALNQRIARLRNPIRR